MTTAINYTVKKATEATILSHLILCDESFVPPLSDRVNLAEYAKKIFEKSISFEAWKNQQNLIGLIAAYFNETQPPSAFITNVSTDKNFMGLGIASQLLKNCIGYAKENNCFEIYLEVNSKNLPAINFYKKYHFIQTEIKGGNLILKLEIKNK